MKILKEDNKSLKIPHNKLDINKIENNINLLLIYPKHKNYLIKNGKITTININDIDKI